MNVWECGFDGCKRAVSGVGGCVGLRAIGWEVIFHPPGSPRIRCPEHYASDADKVPTVMKRHMAEIEAVKIQEHLYLESDPVGGGSWSHDPYPQGRR